MSQLPSVPSTSLAAPAAGEASAELTERLRRLRDALLTGLVERDVSIRLALIAALAGEHLLLLGPPGTAKSLVARRLHLAFADATYFERLLTRFTVPEELFGPLSIKGLEEDRYERLTDRYLPTASIAFLDEIFKANSAILNALLTLLNEREFDNGVQRQGTPLVAVIGASNELPEGEELDALFDRFLLRLHVGPVSADGFRDLLRLRGHASPAVAEADRLTPADLAAVQATAERVEVPPDVEALLCELRLWCTAEEIAVSDRRWRKVVKLLQVSALTNGRTRVSIWDCWLLQHCLWDDPDDREKVYEWYAERVGASAAMDPSRLTRVVTAWEAALAKDQASRSQARDEEGQLLYRGEDGQPTKDARGAVQAKRGKEPLFLAPPDSLVRQETHYNWEWVRVTDRGSGGKGFTLAELDAMRVNDGRSQHSFSSWPSRNDYLVNRANWHTEDIDLAPWMEPTRHKAPYVRQCLGEVDALLATVTQYRDQLEEHVASLAADILTHLWVTPDFVGPASSSLDGTRGEVAALLSRIDQLRRGFELLPQDEPLPPGPVDDPPPSGKLRDHVFKHRTGRGRT